MPKPLRKPVFLGDRSLLVVHAFIREGIQSTRRGDEWNLKKHTLEETHMEDENGPNWSTMFLNTMNTTQCVFLLARSPLPT